MCARRKMLGGSNEEGPMGILSREERTGLEYRRTAFGDAVTLLRNFFDRTSIHGTVTTVGVVRVLKKEQRATQKLLDEDTTKKPNYEACWKEFHEHALSHAWASDSSHTFEATSVVEFMAILVEKHGGPSFDEQVYGKKK